MGSITNTRFESGASEIGWIVRRQRQNPQELHRCGPPRFGAHYDRARLRQSSTASAVSPCSAEPPYLARDVLYPERGSIIAPLWLNHVIPSSFGGASKGPPPLLFADRVTSAGARCLRLLFCPVALPWGDLHQVIRSPWEAEGADRAVLKTQPDHFDALQLLGLLYYQLGNYASAIAFMTKALQIDGRVRYCANEFGHGPQSTEPSGRGRQMPFCCHQSESAGPPHAKQSRSGTSLKGGIGKATACLERAVASDPKLRVRGTHLCRNNLSGGLSC